MLSTVNDAPPSQVQRIMRHKLYGTTGQYVREGKITPILGACPTLS